MLLCVFASVCVCVSSVLTPFCTHTQWNCVIRCVISARYELDSERGFSQATFAIIPLPDDVTILHTHTGLLAPPSALPSGPGPHVLAPQGPAAHSHSHALAPSDAPAVVKTEPGTQALSPARGAGSGSSSGTQPTTPTQTLSAQADKIARASPPPAEADTRERLAAMAKSDVNTSFGLRFS